MITSIGVDEVGVVAGPPELTETLTIGTERTLMSDTACRRRVVAEAVSESAASSVVATAVISAELEVVILTVIITEAAVMVMASADEGTPAATATTSIIAC